MENVDDHQRAAQTPTAAAPFVEENNPSQNTPTTNRLAYFDYNESLVKDTLRSAGRAHQLKHDR